MENTISISAWQDSEFNSREERLNYLNEIEAGKKFVDTDELLTAHKEVFSKVNCLDCGNCCKTTPPIYTRKDVKRIAKHIGIAPKTFIRKYTIEDVDGELTGIRVPCHFLNDYNTCAIYEVRPEACRRYPHTDETEFSQRPEMNYQNTIVCPAAYFIVERLRR